MHTHLLTGVTVVVAAASAVAVVSAQDVPTPPLFAGQQAELDAVRAELRALGVPLTPAELAARVGDVPDELNAAVEVLDLIEALPWRYDPDSAWNRLTDRDNLPLLEGEPPAPVPPEDPLVGWDVVADVLRQYADALDVAAGLDAKVRPAVDRVRADFGIALDDPSSRLLIDEYTPALLRAGVMWKLLEWQLLLATHEGRHDEVAAVVRRLIGFGEAVHAGHPYLSGYIHESGTWSFTADLIARVAPHLTFGDDAMTRDDALGLIALLLDDAHPRRGFREAVESEFVRHEVILDSILGGEFESATRRRGWGQYPRPLTDRVVEQALLTRERLEGVASAREEVATLARLTIPMLDAADYERLPRHLVTTYREHIDSATPASGEWLNRLVFTGIDRLTVRHYRIRDRRSLAAVVLAANLYRHDHGELPDSLDPLVPHYLPRVPVDAMTSDGFVKYDRERGIAWIVGRDGVDYGGISRDDRLRDNPDLSQRQRDALGHDDVVRLTLQPDRPRSS